MRIFIYAGLEYQSAKIIQSALAEKRGGLLKSGVLFPQDNGLLGPQALFTSILHADHADPTRSEFGFADAERLETLRARVNTALSNAILQNKPNTVIVSVPYAMSRLSTLPDVRALHAFFSTFSDDLHAVAFLPPPDQAMVANLTWQFTFGRTSDLSTEAALMSEEDYHKAANRSRATSSHHAVSFPAVQNPAAFLDYKGLSKLWAAVFGEDKLRFLPWRDRDQSAEDIRNLTRAAFDLPGKIGRPSETRVSSAGMTLETIARLRAVNEILLDIERRQGVLPQRLRRRIASEIAIEGQQLLPGHVSSLVPQPEIPAGLDLSAPLDVPLLAPDTGFDAARFVAGYAAELETAAHLVRKRAASLKKERKARRKASRAAQTIELSDAGRRFLDQRAKALLPKLASGRLAPGSGQASRMNETVALPEIPPDTRASHTGTLIIGCMKNEGPYILEWIAFHLGIGVDTFLIYSNNCADGTDDILERLHALGIIRHVSNDNWRGRSPQKAALSHAYAQPEYKQAKWVMHIDIDEFVNIRIGENGCLDELYAAMENATNLAMTWRLFGHNDVSEFTDAPVLSQFTHCAPDWCPKPHTAWGFKTLFKNIEAYSKLSCHRPKGLSEDLADRVIWVNGSLREMGQDVKARGWRSNQQTIGYNAVQLNHYALRSAESFLIKRDRGRALHVDRTVGMNYWTRMDWNSRVDLSIQRHLPRTLAIMNDLRQDQKLNDLHQRAVAWHQQKAKALRKDPEFQRLFDHARAMRLTDIERVAATLAADVES